jgi:ABC-type transport system substrate-binding protein
MEDPIVGGFGKGKLVRQAIALALDTGELAEAFYNKTAISYDGPIPPGLEGHKPGVISPYRGPNLELAKKKLEEAGYPNGQGLPVLSYHTNRGGNSPEQTEMVARQLKKAGIQLQVNLHSFPELDDMVKKRKAQIFNMSWGSDYPDAENNLALFYGPNADAGSTYFTYRNPEFDALYQKASVMSSSPERTALYEEMRDLIIEDCPAIGSMGRTRYFVANKRVKNFHPDETWYTWIKHVGVEPLE